VTGLSYHVSPRNGSETDAHESVAGEERVRRSREGLTAAAAFTGLVRRLVDVLGGRFSSELGIDVDSGDAAVERWFLAATLFGNRISAPIAIRTYRTLAAGGVATSADVEGRSWEELVALLDAGGYVRYDFRTATRLQRLAAALRERHGGRVAALRLVHDPARLEAELDALPGWGPTTVRLFLRELRGVWPGAQPALDGRALAAAQHLGLLPEPAPADVLARLEGAARRDGVDPRDIEAALVRLALAHGRRFAHCSGGAACDGLAAPSRTESDTS
jgi:endonuclease III